MYIYYSILKKDISKIYIVILFSYFQCKVIYPNNIFIFNDDVNCKYIWNTIFYRLSSFYFLGSKIKNITYQKNIHFFRYIFL